MKKWIKEWLIKECELLEIDVPENIIDDITMELYEYEPLWEEFYDSGKFLLCKYYLENKTINLNDIKLSEINWKKIQDEINKKQ